MKVTLAEFENELERYFDIALREPVEIVEDGETRFVVMSLGQYKLLTKEHAIAESEAAPEQAQLDAGLDSDPR